MDNVIKNKKGFTSFDLKIIGMILMIMDHLGHFFPFVPPWFRTIGRLTAPIFLFLSAEGFYHTRNKKRYIGMMYLFAIINHIGNSILTNAFPDPQGRIFLMNNIFLTLAVSLSVMYVIDKIKNKDKMILNIILLVLLSVLSIFVEGTFIFVGIAVMFYFFRDKKGLKYSLYIIISLYLGLSPVLKGTLPLSSMLTSGNSQWVMVFSLIFIALYNGEKGRHLNKYFFYIFYPAHIWLLFLISMPWR